MKDAPPVPSSDPTAPWVAEYDMTPAEVTAFFRYHTEFSPMARRAYWLGFIFLVGLLPGATWISAGKIWPGEVPCLFCLFTAALVVCLTYRWWRIPVLSLGRAYMHRTARKKRLAPNRSYVSRAVSTAC